MQKSKSWSGKYSKKVFDYAKQSATDAFKTASKRAIQRTAKSTGDLIGNKISNKITKCLKNSETVTNKHDKKIRKERYISPEKNTRNN